jgi:hypothetical protein
VILLDQQHSKNVPVIVNFFCLEWSDNDERTAEVPQ